jgi:hypothetical protein
MNERRNVYMILIESKLVFGGTVWGEDLSFNIFQGYMFYPDIAKENKVQKRLARLLAFLILEGL